MSDTNEENGSGSKELTLSAIKEYLLAKGGRVKYAELFDHFRNLIVDATTDDRFQEFLSNVATKKYDNKQNDNATEEWIILKKKYMDTSNTSPPNSGFFASTLQKTKHNLSKFSNAFSNKSDKDLVNKSLNTSSALNLTSKLNGSSSASKINSNSSYSSSSLNSFNDTITSKHNSSKLNEFGSEINNLSKKTNSLVILDAGPFLNNKTSSNSSLTKSTITTSSPLNNVDTSQTENDTTVKIEADENESINFKSVKEHAKKLNRLNTETELRNLVDMKPTISSTRPNSGNSVAYKSVADSVKNKSVEIESFNFSDPKAHEKEWIMVCSRGDYMELAKILCKTPYLAQKKDPFNTCAHWACKHGNVEILKLLASTLENDTKTNPKSIRINHLINSKTGYTCLHIAYLFGHSELVPILRTYGAEGLTDYSGKIGIDYSKTPTVFDYHLNLSDPRPASQDLTNDASTLIKRSTSSLSKEKESAKNEFGFNSMKLNDNKQSRPKIINFSLNESPLKRIQTKPVHSSPLNLIESFSNLSLGTGGHIPMLKHKGKQLSLNDDSIQEPAHLRESKENIFI